MVKSATDMNRALVSVAATRHSKFVRNYVSRRVRNPQDVEDIAQAALLKLLRSAEGKVTADNLLPCLITIVRSEVIDFLKQQARDDAFLVWRSDVERLAEDHMVANSEFYPTGNLEQQEQSRERLYRVVKVLNNMSSTLSTPLLLSACNGMSDSEIAEQLKMKEATVRKYIQRARAELRVKHP